MTALRLLGGWFRDLRLVWKLLIPLVGMTLVVGLVGTFAIVRELNDRAQVDLERDLLRRSATAEAAVRDLGLSLSESVRFGANIEGVAAAVERGDEATARGRLASVPAAQEVIDFLVVTDRDGLGLVEVVRRGDRLEADSGTPWGERGAGDLLAASGGRQSFVRSGFLDVGDGTVLAASGPVVHGDEVVGTIIVGADANDAARFAAQRAGTPVELYDPTGRVVAVSEGTPPTSAPPDAPARSQVRRTEDRRGEERAVVYSPLETTGASIGRLSVQMPTGPAFATARGATLRLILLVLAAMVGVVVLGVVVARLVLRQVGPLVETSRALGSGDLAARAHRFGDDELGEVARGMNLMAEQLEAAQEELELRVAARTEELERLYGDLVQAEEGRSEFFTQVVHEFRNQLFAIRTHADMMGDPDFEPDTPSWREEYGRVISDAAMELLRRVDEILELARAEAGKTEFEFEDVQVADAVAHLRPTVSALARRGDLDAEFDVPNNLPRVRADRHRLGQILMNLVSNAVKYTPPGGRMVLSARRSGDVVEVSVEDTGIGVPEDAGDRLFEPFYRAAGRGGDPGFTSSGLGLAVTKRLVEGHGGHVGYVSRSDVGTTFTFTIPLTRPARRRAGRATAASRSG